jgi:hypothetical protein
MGNQGIVSSRHSVTERIIVTPQFLQVIPYLWGVIEKKSSGIFSSRFDGFSDFARCIELAQHSGNAGSMLPKGEIISILPEMRNWRT